jgi:hypothetical protein
MKHSSSTAAAAAATAKMYQRCVNVDRLKYLPLEESGFHSNELVPHKNNYLSRK